MPDNLRVLGNVVLPEKVALVLKNRPKFSVVPKVSAHKLLALNQGISRSADEENRERCLLEGANSFLRNRRNGRPKLTTGRVVSYFKEHELSLLQADKEGGFVVMSTSGFQDKASSAIMKNFESTTVKASKCAKSAKDAQLRAVRYSALSADRVKQKWSSDRLRGDVEKLGAPLCPAWLRNQRVSTASARVHPVEIRKPRNLQRARKFDLFKAPSVLDDPVQASEDSFMPSRPAAASDQLQKKRLSSFLGLDDSSETKDDTQKR
ncbi:hypothetical protein HPB51_027696 [Rhipicephalus microplus]|uniref:Uncharacterized protein n=1 Tax=Rhipicephalus microplus TaxID=6941 RepID=A0A9J6CZ57_RHIMP|nr:hypothetical protein HPB51_027696 [Rhipicephalus microplus]